MAHHMPSQPHHLSPLLQAPAHRVGDGVVIRQQHCAGGMPGDAGRLVQQGTCKVHTPALYTCSLALTAHHHLYQDIGWLSTSPHAHKHQCCQMTLWTIPPLLQATAHRVDTGCGYMWTIGRRRTGKGNGDSPWGKEDSREGEWCWGKGKGRGEMTTPVWASACQVVHTCILATMMGQGRRTGGTRAQHPTLTTVSSCLQGELGANGLVVSKFSSELWFEPDFRRTRP